MTIGPLRPYQVCTRRHHTHNQRTNCYPCLPQPLQPFFCMLGAFAAAVRAPHRTSTPRFLLKHCRTAASGNTSGTTTQASSTPLSGCQPALLSASRGDGNSNSKPTQQPASSATAVHNMSDEQRSMQQQQSQQPDDDSHQQHQQQTQQQQWTPQQEHFMSLAFEQVWVFDTSVSCLQMCCSGC